MDKNALTEKRRETVIGLLKSMNIKKSADGGFDKADVYDCMQQLCDLYEKNIEDLQNTYEGEIVSLKEKYQKYDDNNELYVSLIMEAKKSSNEIINQAKTEVENILAEGKEQIAKQEEELQVLYAGVEAEKAAITEELNASRRAVEAEKAAMQAEVDAEKEKCIALKNKYNQLMNAMEEEYMEIKTNILRTAGKVDSLKSKLTSEETITWDIAPIEDEVAFPEPEIQIEDILEIPEVQIPEISIETPVAEVELPEVEVPVVEEVVPEISVADIEIPEIELPEIEAEIPEISVDEIELPEIAIEEPVSDIPQVDELAEAIEAESVAPAALNLSDIFAEAEAEEEAKPAEEINFDTISFDDIDFSSLDEEPAEAVEEISFEGLENLFKED